MVVFWRCSLTRGSVGLAPITVEIVWYWSRRCLWLGGKSQVGLWV